MAGKAHKALAVFLALLGVAAIAGLVPMLDAMVYANREGGQMLVLSLMMLMILVGVFLLFVAWRFFKR